MSKTSPIFNNCRHVAESNVWPERHKSDDAGIDLEEMGMHAKKSSKVLRLLEGQALELDILF